MSNDTETAYLAGGCGWVMQQLLRHPEGVVATRVGWMGGWGDGPTEHEPQGHAETVEVVLDPERLSFRGLLEVYFLSHRADLAEDVVGSIYRSEIFCTSQEQRRVAEETIRDVDAAQHWPGPTATRASDAGTFVPMSAEDQDYLLRFPRGCAPPFPRQPDTELASQA